MMDTMLIYSFVAAMRHAGYFSFAVAVLGLAEAHYSGLRRAMRRVTAILANARGATLRRSTAPVQARQAIESAAVPRP